MADLASLDAVRVLDGSPTAVLAPAVQAAAERSAQRNGLAGDPAAAVTARAGTWASATRTFTPTGPAEVPDAVEVTVRNAGEGMFLRESFSPRRTAVATRSGLAGVWMGAAPAVLDADDAALLNALAGEALGVGASLSLASWQAVASTRVTIADLAVAAGLPPAQVRTVLDQSMTADAAIRLLAAAAGGTSGGTALASLPGVAPPPVIVQLGQVLAVGESLGPLVDTSLSLLDLARGVLEVASVGQPITTTFTVPVSGASGTTATVVILDAHALTVGRAGASAHTVRARASIDLTLDAPANGNVVHVPLVIDLTSGTATLTAVTCSAAGTGTPGQVDVAVQTGAATIGVGSFDGSGAVVPGTITTAPPLTPVEAVGTTTVPGVAAALGFTTYDLAATQTVGAVPAPGAAVESILAVTGDPSLTADVEPPLRSAVPPIIDAVGPALADLLGVNLGAADIAVPGAGCTAPALVR